LERILNTHAVLKITYLWNRNIIVIIIIIIIIIPKKKVGRGISYKI